MIEQLDARQLLCPLPVIRVQNAMNKLAAGQQLEVWCTDPGTLHDIPTWCRINGHEVVKSEQREREIYFLLQKCEEE